MESIFKEISQGDQFLAHLAKGHMSYRHYLVSVIVIDNFLKLSSDTTPPIWIVFRRHL